MRGGGLCLGKEGEEVYKGQTYISVTCASYNRGQTQPLNIKNMETLLGVSRL